MIHQRHITLILCSLPLFAWVACNRSASNNQTFDYGTYTDGRYTNPFFNLEIDVPPHWNVFSQVQNAGLMKSEGKPQVASKVKTALLLTAAQFQEQHANDTAFNPNLLLLAENLGNNRRIQTPSDYLKITRHALQQNPAPKVFPFHHTYPEELIHGITFVRLRVVNQATSEGTPEFTQDYFATLHRGFALTYILTYRTERQRQALEQVVRTTKIGKE